MEPIGQAQGKLFGVGVGPGDPELLTLKAYHLLRRVPVICVPQGGPGEGGYTWDIIQPLVDASRQEVLHLHFPMTRSDRERAPFWEQAVASMGERWARGLDCAFVTLGDPLLYSTFVHVLRLVRERYPTVKIEIVPGVSAITAAAAQVLLPLAEGDDRVAILPATASPTAVEEALTRFDCVILLKANRGLEAVLELLARHRLEDKAVFISRATTPQERVVTRLAELKGQELDYMSLIIVRK